MLQRVAAQIPRDCCVAERCSVLHCVAACCGVLQRVAAQVPRDCCVLEVCRVL